MATTPHLKKRASRAEIFAHLRTWLGEEAVSVAKEVARLAIAGQNEQALELLKAYDRKIGGVGLHWFEEKRQLGVYRAFFYVLLPLRASREPQHEGRRIVYSACVYLEELLKRMVRLNLIEKFRDGANRMPLGALVKKLRKKADKQFPSQVLEELDWLAQGVYNFAKHAYNFELLESPPEHYFELDEAIAVYLLVRKVGVILEDVSGKTATELK